MRPVSIPNTFQTKTGQIPLSQLDSNFTTLATAINDLNTGNAYYVDSSGTANQIVVTTPSGITAVYEAGLAISVQVANTNTATAVTININGQGATNLSNLSGTTGVAIGQITALDIIDLVFDGTSFILTGGSGLATSTMSMSLAGNFTLPVPTSGTTLSVNGLSGQAAIQANGSTGSSVNINAATSGAGQASITGVITALYSLTMNVNNTGAAVQGIPTAGCGLYTPQAIPMVLAVGGAARLTIGASAGQASSYQFAGSLLTTTATAGSQTLPANPAGFWEMQLNGTSVKVPYYNV